MYEMNGGGRAVFRSSVVRVHAPVGPTSASPDPNNATTQQHDLITSHHVTSHHTTSHHTTTSPPHSGKVYKAIWRGTTVAVKTMILPATMSGAEKRERMAIMEAAISSAMAHPNIVQTFTYRMARHGTTTTAASTSASASAAAAATAGAGAAVAAGGGGGAAAGGQSLLETAAVPDGMQ